MTVYNVTATALCMVIFAMCIITVDRALPVSDNFSEFTACTKQPQSLFLIAHARLYNIIDDCS